MNNKIGQIYKSQTPIPMQDVSQIEDLIFLSKKMQDRIQFLKQLKKKRIKVIEDQINLIESRQCKVKDSISQTLKVFNKKSISFPGVGKVSNRNVKGGIQILDESQLINDIQKNHPQHISVIKVQKKIIKKQLNNLIQSHQLHQDVTSAITKSQDRISISVSYDQDIQHFRDTEKDMTDQQLQTTDQNFDRI